MMRDKSLPLITHNDHQQLMARKKLLQLFKETPIPDDQIIESLGLYTRSVMLAKTLYINEIYQKILPIPGIVLEFGVWWGANLAILNNFRNVYEPYNRNRRIVGFDTFKGYDSITKNDGNSPYTVKGNYSTTDNYIDYLSQILDTHESDNVLSHVKKYELVEGNVVETVERYFKDKPETIVALAYFDLQLYEPTQKCLEAIRPYLIRGTILAMDELASREFPGETIALKETLGFDKYKIFRSQVLADRSYLVIE